MVSSSTYFVENELVVSEGSHPVGQAVEEDQGLQGELTETSGQTKPQLKIMIMILVVTSLNSYYLYLSYIDKISRTNKAEKEMFARSTHFFWIHELSETTGDCDSTLQCDSTLC